jgi:hypothetical protein
MVRGHEGDAGRPVVGREVDDPARLEADREAEAADVEVAAGGQLVGDDDRVAVDEAHAGLPGRAVRA